MLPSFADDRRRRVRCALRREPSALAQSDADFLAAKRGVRAGRLAPKLDALAPRARRSRPRAATSSTGSSSSRLDSAAARRCRLHCRYPDTPLADRLRVDWLKSLGSAATGRASRSTTPPPAGEDIELACYDVQYRCQRDGDAALAAAKPLWFTGRRTPDACDPLFAALIARGELSAADRRARFRLATRSRQRASRAGDRRRPARAKDRITDARVRRGRSRSAAARSRRASSPGRPPAAASSRCYALERAARKRRRRARAPRGSSGATSLPEADRRYGNARARLSRRAAAASVGQRVVPRGSGDAASDADAAGVARARGVARRGHGTT